jgi:hypothetical protein
MISPAACGKLLDVSSASSPVGSFLTVVAGGSYTLWQRWASKHNSRELAQIVNYLLYLHLLPGAISSAG